MRSSVEVQWWECNWEGRIRRWVWEKDSLSHAWRRSDYLIKSFRSRQALCSWSGLMTCGGEQLWWPTLWEKQWHRYRCTCIYVSVGSGPTGVCSPLLYFCLLINRNDVNKNSSWPPRHCNRKTNLLKQSPGTDHLLHLTPSSHTAINTDGRDNDDKMELRLHELIRRFLALFAVGWIRLAQGMKAVRRC